ncbi:hypothetical protein AAVH_38504, partial [Aphelenchoides avenae]
MLPAESLTDVVAFFQAFDLDALLLSNKQLSDIARQAAGKIRVSDFSDFFFCLHSYNGVKMLS